MELSDLKRKLRQLKKLEARIRFQDQPLRNGQSFIWDEYFSTRDPEDSQAKYSLKSLQKKDHAGLKEVFDEYFYHIYFTFFKENGVKPGGLYDPDLLSLLGLPTGAAIETIKKKFRELAKKYHPDHGGDSDKFIELINTYRKLTGEE